jgi:hypothetical protein
LAGGLGSRAPSSFVAAGQAGKPSNYLRERAAAAPFVRA